MVEPAKLQQLRELAAIAQAGLTYATDQFDIERYSRLQKLAAELLTEHSSADAETILECLSFERGYPTPKVDVRGVILDSARRILLVRESADSSWALPGGWADVNNTPSENIEREILEEAGLVVRAERLLMVLDRARHAHVPLDPRYCYKLFFLCEWLSGEPSTGLETDCVGFFDIDNLPCLSLSRVLPEQIVQIAILAADPNAPTVFD